MAKGKLEEVAANENENEQRENEEKGASNPQEGVAPGMKVDKAPQYADDEIYAANQWPLLRLFTHHDKLNHHKMLGVCVLLHFLYRMSMVPIHGNMQWLLESRITPVAILLHLALSCSALQFRVPVKRTGVKPMIYREFLLHSLIFAARSLFVMLLCYWQPPGYLILRVPVVLVMHYLADQVTEMYGKYVPKTMRGMPYSENTPEWVEKIMYRYYALSQFFATYACLCAHMDSVFIVVLPIQLAALLMTLVRKNLISATSWHIWYAGALGLNWVYLAWGGYLMVTQGHKTRTPETMMVAKTCSSLGTSITILWGYYGRHYVSKYAFWAAIGLIHAWRSSNYNVVIWGPLW